MKMKITVLFLAIMLLPLAAFAEDAPRIGAATHPTTGTMVPFYDMILTIHGSCYIENGELAMSGTVTAQGGKSTSAKVTITLQHNDGTNWKNGSSWSATGTNSVTKQATATASANTFYRLKVTGTITYNGKSESDTIYTGVVAL